MKYILILLFFFCFLSTEAQYIVKENKDQEVGTLTKSGISYIIYLSERGKLYYWKYSNNGNLYKVYIKNSYIVSRRQSSSFRQ